MNGDHRAAPGGRGPRPGATRLRRSTDFEQVLKTGARIGRPAFVLHYRANGGENPRLGLGVSRRVASLASRRNTIKRVIRETFRAHLAVLPSVDLVVIARAPAAALTRAELRNAVAGALARVTL